MYLIIFHFQNYCVATREKAEETCNLDCPEGQETAPLITNINFVMKQIFILILSLIAIKLTGNAQILQLHYSGTNQKIIEAVAEANKILASSDFLNRIDTIQKFDNTTYNGHQIISEMKSVNTVEVSEYFKRHTRTNAKTKTQIRINTAKLNRSLASIVNTLIHESIHATDWLVNKHWDYTHRTQYQEMPPISAPYVIGAMAESMIR